MNKIVKTVNILHWLYKACLAPFLGQNCRFHPSCSDYCKEAFQSLPARKAFYLTIKRIIRCNPWNKACGFDPVSKSD